MFVCYFIPRWKINDPNTLSQHTAHEFLMSCWKYSETGTDTIEPMTSQVKQTPSDQRIEQTMKFANNLMWWSIM